MQNEFICKRSKKNKRLEVMVIFLVFVELGHCAEKSVTVWAGEFGIPMKSPPVIGPMRGFTETLDTILTCARNENCLGFVVNMKLVVSQGILVCQSLVAALDGALPHGPHGRLPPPQLSVPGRHLGQLSSRHLDLLCNWHLDLLCNRLLDLLSNRDLLRSLVQLDRSILRDLDLVHHHPFTIWVKGNADLHFDKTREALKLRLGHWNKP